MKIDIIGAGALGLLLAGKLIQAGAEVRLWCRGEEQSRKLAGSGLTISYENGGAPIYLPGDKFRAAPITGFAEAALREPGDWTVITLKQNAFHNALPSIMFPLRDHKLRVVCFQNGSGHLELLQELLPQASIWAAVTTEAAKRKSLTEVIHTGKGEIYVGEKKKNKYNYEKIAQEQNIAAAFSLIEALAAAGFSASMSKEVDTMIYRKLLINAVINPLTAIWRIPNGELPATSQRMQLMKELYMEVISVYDACGIPYDVNAWESILEVCRATAGNTSSMLADVLASRATEIRWINGSIVDMAERCSIAVPLHRSICRLVEGMNVKER